MDRSPGAPPIAPRRAQIVYDAHATGIRAWVWDVAFGRRRRPVIVYATFPRGVGAIYWYAVFNGRRWVSHRITAGGGSISPGTIESDCAGGITLDHSDPSVVYASVQVHGGYEIERWATPDGGVPWTHATVVPADSIDNVRPVVPRGHAGAPWACSGCAVVRHPRRGPLFHQRRFQQRGVDVLG